MHCAGVCGTQCGHNFLRHSAVGDGLYTADKAAFFDDQFAVYSGGESAGHRIQVACRGAKDFSKAEIALCVDPLNLIGIIPA